jgi:hypothetical protein
MPRTDAQVKPVTGRIREINNTEKAQAENDM